MSEDTNNLQCYQGDVTLPGRCMEAAGTAGVGVFSNTNNLQCYQGFVSLIGRRMEAAGTAGVGVISDTLLFQCYQGFVSLIGRRSRPPEAAEPPCCCKRGFGV